MEATFILGLRALKRRDKVPLGLWRIGVFFFFVVDAAYDWIYGTLIFLEEPKELTFTQRVCRHMRGPEGWRKSLAIWICRWFFEPFDKLHCIETEQRAYWK